MKTATVTYERVGTHRLFYMVGEDDSTPGGVSANCYTAGSGKKVVSWGLLESGIWDLSFDFELPGKYLFSIYEDGYRKLVLIVTITNE